MQLEDFDYALAPERIAQQPTLQRTASRLLLLDGKSGAVQDRTFTDLVDLLLPGDLLVMNDTQVIPARVFARKETGGRVEILVERVLDAETLLAQVRASKSLKAGGILLLEPGEIRAIVQGRQDEFYILRLDTDLSAQVLLQQIGHVPLPPYIHRTDTPADRDRYQTVYARQPGAVAAPTAGLHFDDKILERLQQQGIALARVTLHVGAGTFQPVRVTQLEEHRMHAERVTVDERVCEQIRSTRNRGGRVIAIGTTTVRALETAGVAGRLGSYEGESELFIYPGFRFRVIDGLITNFHLPRSSLLMMVCAYAGRESVLSAYHHAMEQGYRFYSYGDAMFVTPAPGVLDYAV